MVFCTVGGGVEWGSGGFESVGDFFHERDGEAESGPGARCDGEAFACVGSGVLDGEGNFGAHEEDHPAGLYPE